MSEQEEQIKQFETAIAQLEAQRAILGDAVVDASIIALRDKLAALSSSPQEERAVELHGERRQATILLADVKGSTELAEQVDTETWVEIMNRVFHLLGDAIYRHGGEIDQYRGDGLVAFFGARAAHEDDPERAVRAALAMQEAVKGYATELEAERGVELLLRIGINTGEVIAAEVGDRQQHSEDTAMGRAIALAARMESAAQPGTVLVTANTYRLTRTLFEWQALGEISVKGVSQPVTVYRPLAAHATAGKGRGIEGLSSPLVGRDEEMASLRAAIDDVQHGVGGIVTLVGEAGLGKSRLVAELRNSVLSADRESPNLKSENLQWIEGRCISYGGSIAYLLWLDVLRGLLNVTSDTPPLAVRGALRARVQALCPDSVDAVYPYLCRLLSLPLEEEYESLRGLQGESLRAGIFAAAQTLIESTARQQPLVLVCEDLHWADATSLALLERVLTLTDRAALLTICVFRPEVEHGCWQLKERAARAYRHRHTDLWLDTLSADESQSLVGHLLRVEDLPSALHATILDHAEGNPFYVEEILRALIDDGAIVHSAGRWRAMREIARIPIPDTLHGVLAARIDRLQEETRRVLRLASVIGRVFLYRILVEIVSEEEHLDIRLLTLQRQQLIRERARVPEPEYVFKHVLTQETAYNGLLGQERRVCHRKVAEALERLFPDRTEEQLGLLAYHWERAGDAERAVEYLVHAGEQARAAYANQEATSYYERALDLMDTLPPGVLHGKKRLTALSGLGKAFFKGGQIPEAEAPLREAITLGKEGGLAPRELVQLYWWLAEVLTWQRRANDRMCLVEEGLALLEEDAESVETALMTHHLALGHLAQGHHAKFREYILRAAQIAWRLPYVEELGTIFDWALTVYRADKNVIETQKWIQGLEERARRHHDLRALANVRFQAGWSLYCQGRLGEAKSETKRALDQYERIGDARYTSWALQRLGTIYLAFGDPNAAEASAHRSLKMANSRGSIGERLWAQATMGLVLLCQGAAQKAIRTLQEATRLNDESSDQMPEALPTLHLGQAYLVRGQRHKALEQFRRAALLMKSNTLESTNDATPGMLVKAVALLEQACDDPETFRTFCGQYRERHLEPTDARYARFTQWYLEPVSVREMRAAPWRDGFAALSSAWAWEDPLGDCSFSVRNGLEICAANGRDLWHLNQSAPRLLRRVTGDLIAQTICVPLAQDQPAIGGLVLWRDKENYVQLERGVFGRCEITFRGCVENQDIYIGRGRLPIHTAQDEPADRVYLRLERVNSQVNALCSLDGQQWFTVGYVTFPVADPIRVGLHAIGSIDRTIYHGAYAEGTAIRFESFRLWQT